MNVYHNGAVDGLYMGLYLSLMFLLQMMGITTPMLLVIGELMILGLPIFAYLRLHKSYKEEHYRSHFSAIWMHGITMFICGCLIMGLVAYIYLRFIKPNFIADLFETASQFYISLGDEEYVKMGNMLHAMIEKHLLPTPIGFAFSMMWLGSFLGAMLSMVIAAILKFSNRFRKKQ